MADIGDNGTEILVMVRYTSPIAPKQHITQSNARKNNMTPWNRSAFRITELCGGNPPVTDILTSMASNAELSCFIVAVRPMSRMKLNYVQTDLHYNVTEMTCQFCSCKMHFLKPIIALFNHNEIRRFVHTLHISITARIGFVKNNTFVQLFLNVLPRLREEISMNIMSLSTQIRFRQSNLICQAL